MYTKDVLFQYKSLFKEILVGFFDADGSFAIRLYFGSNMLVTFYINIVFVQKDETVLKMIFEIVDLPANTLTGKRLHDLDSGNKTESRNKSFSFASSTGQKFLEIMIS